MCGILPDVFPVLVGRPERWWLAAPSDLAEFVDPDISDGRQRHHDRQVLDWGGIADAVELVGGAIAQGQTYVDDEGDCVCDVVVDHLGQVERHIVQSWLDTETPMGDPTDTLTNGRHRLWCSWSLRPSVRLPITSAILIDEASDQLNRITADEASRLLEGMPAKVRSTSPLYIQELELHARRFR